MRTQAARLDRQIIAVARASAPCRLMLTAPGVGPSAIAYRDGSALTALSYASMIEDPANFKNARAAGATIGLTPRSYQSGEIAYDGHIDARRQTRPRAALRSRDSGVNAAGISR